MDLSNGSNIVSGGFLPLDWPFEVSLWWRMLFPFKEGASATEA